MSVVAGSKEALKIWRLCEWNMWVSVKSKLRASHFSLLKQKLSCYLEPEAWVEPANEEYASILIASF